MGRHSHWKLPVGVRNVVNALLSSSSFNPKKAYLKSKEVNMAFPCKNCNVAVTSGITLGGGLYQRIYWGKIYN